MQSFADRPAFDEEHAMLARGHRSVAGVDEAGRGAWAGPVTAAAVVFEPSASTLRALAGVNDSKKLSAQQREVLRERIVTTASAWAVGMSSSAEIDALGIVPATRLAMTRAIFGLRIAPESLLIDAVKLPAVALTQKSFPFADSISLSVAAASILAKTARDDVMRDLHIQESGYGFDEHKGYGTALHRRMLAALGASPHHRFSFRPLRALAQTA
jgi:ribonuclease HII